jgi:tetratricopeptide (TPR) repeat protein
MRALLISTCLGATFTLTACGPRLAPLDRGIVHYNDARYVAALAAFDEAVGEDPRSAVALNDRGVTRMRLGNPVGAIADYSRALELRPDDAEFHFNRGNAYVAANNLVAAVSDYTRATQIDPSYGRAFWNRGTARFLGGDVDGARRDWRFAADIEPDPWVKASMRRSAALDVPATSSGAAGATLAPMPPGPVAGQPGAGVTVQPGGATPPAGGVTVPVPPPPAPGAMTPRASVLVPDVPPFASPQTTPPAVAAPDAPRPAPPLLPAEQMDARTLATRAVSRSLDGDRAGAIQDMRAAVAREHDVERRARLEQFLRFLETGR